MVTEEQVKSLAYSLWQQEGCPEGKDVEHYHRARQILELRESNVDPASDAMTMTATPTRKASPTRSRARKT